MGGAAALGIDIARTLQAYFGRDVPDHLEAPRYIVQHLGDVLAEPGHCATACGTSAGHHRSPVRARPAGAADDRAASCALASPRSAPRTVPFSAIDLDRVRRLAGLQLLQPEFELLDLAGDLLRRAAELHPAQLGDLELELLDLQGAALNRQLGRRKLGARGRKLGLAGERKARRAALPHQAADRPRQAT